MDESTKEDMIHVVMVILDNLEGKDRLRVIRRYCMNCGGPVATCSCWDKD